MRCGATCGFNRANSWAYGKAKATAGMPTCLQKKPQDKCLLKVATNRDTETFPHDTWGCGWQALKPNKLISLRTLAEFLKILSILIMNNAREQPGRRCRK